MTSVQTGHPASRFLAGLLTAGLFLTSLYVLPSGLPQPADLFLALFVFSAIFQKVGKRETVSVTGVYRVMFVFVLYAVIISVAWSVLLGDTGIVMYPVYYIYNIAIVLAIAGLVRQNEEYWIRSVERGITLGILLAGVLLVYNFDRGLARQTGGFNNPNQLGYFGLTSLSALLILDRYHPVPRLHMVASYAVSVACIGASLSLTAMGGLGAVALGTLLKYGVDIRKVLSAAVILLVVAYIGWGFTGTPLYEYSSDMLSNRVGVFERKATNVSSQRGYERIIRYPEYMLVGAAEGGLGRFDHPAGTLNNIEIHSTFGTLLFSYGIPGIAMIGAFIFLVVSRRRLSDQLIALGPMIYSLTHQGLRSTGFWIFLFALAYTYELNVRAENGRAR